MPFDYNQVRLFSWNSRKHRYETAYRQRNVFGLLPVSIGKETFENVGEQPTFTIRVRGESGSPAEQKYRLEGVIVKRVLAPGETPVKAARAVVAGAKLNRCCGRLQNRAAGLRQSTPLRPHTRERHRAGRWQNPSTIWQKK